MRGINVKTCHSFPNANQGKLAIAVTILGLLLQSCGSSNSEPQSLPGPQATPDTELANMVVLNGVNVPPAPPESLNSTLLGVDGNDNGVRDDVERVLAAQYGAGPNKELIEVAKMDQAFLAIPMDSVEALAAHRTASLRQIYCLTQANTNIGLSELRVAYLTTHNSRTRLDAAKQRMDAVADQIVMLDDSICTGAVK
jgi:hypothetical protein